MVGRPREFDIDQALDDAMRAFWAKGYEATSMVDLMDATGLHKGSIYQAFGDKHSLFIQSLKRYLAKMLREETAVLKAASSPLQGLRDMVHAMIDMTDDDGDVPKGCMAINTLIELAPHDEAVKKVMMDHMGATRATVRKTIAAAQAAGEMTDKRPAELLTSLMMVFMMGLATSSKAALTKTQAHELVDEHINTML